MQFCRDDRECHALLLEQLPEARPPRKKLSREERESGGVTNTRPNEKASQRHHLARLRRDRPDLAERVIAGDLSASAAAIEAGFRRPMKSIPIDSPESAVKALLRVFDRADLLAALLDA